MKTRKMSFAEAIQSLKESLNSEIKEEREIAQSLLDQHYGYRGDFDYEKINEHKDRIQHKRLE